VRIAARITALLSSAPRHQRALLAPLASQAQQTLRVPLGAAAERRLLTLSRAEAVDARWLGEIAALATGRAFRGAPPSEPETLLVILLRRARGERGA
jgi:hypothetical protein